MRLQQPAAAAANCDLEHSDERLARRFYKIPKHLSMSLPVLPGNPLEPRAASPDGGTYPAGTPLSGGRGRHSVGSGEGAFQFGGLLKVEKLVNQRWVLI